MRKVTGNYTDCPICKTEQKVERVKDRNMVVVHMARSEDGMAFCDGSNKAVPDKAVQVVRLG